MFVDDFPLGNSSATSAGFNSLAYTTHAHHRDDLFDHIDLDDDIQWNFSLVGEPTTEFLIPNHSLDFLKLFDNPMPEKSELRHHDCMWSGRCTTHPEKGCTGAGHKHKMASSATATTTHEASAEATEPKRQCTSENGVDNAAIMNDAQQPTCGALQPHLIHTTATQQQFLRKTIDATIPAGRSLLINSRLTKPANSMSIATTKPSEIMQLPTVTTNEFLKEREGSALRPESPLSLEEDPPEFKHTIDLAACTVGSNSTPLLNADGNPPHTDYSGRSRYNNLLSDAANDVLNDLLKDIRTFSDFEEEASDTDSKTNNIPTTSIHMHKTNRQHSHVSPQPLTAQQQLALQHLPTPAASSATSSAGTSPSYDFNQTTMHGDHSYTRSKNMRVDVLGLGVQTPSDSGELIEQHFVMYKTWLPLCVLSLNVKNSLLYYFTIRNMVL